MTLLQNVRHRTVEEHRRQKAAARDEPEDCRKGKVACKRDVPDTEEDGEGRKGKIARTEPDAKDLPGEIVVRELVARQKETTESKAAATSTTTKTTASTTAKVTSTTAKTTSVSSTSAKPTSVSSTTSASVSSTTSTTSTTSISSTSSTLTTGTSTTSSITSSVERALSSTTSVSSTFSALDASSSLSASDTNNTPAETTSGLQTGTIIGIIAGSIAALMVIGALVSFFLRRLRTKRRRAEVFNPSEFRRSGVLLEEKQPDVRPRPPSMIERRNVQGTPSVASNSLPPPPSLAYPYSDRAIPPSPSAPPSMYGGSASDHGHHQQQYAQYGAAGAHFGNLPSSVPPPSAGGMYNGVPPPGAYGAHYEQAGYGAPPVPGTYAPGAYASYGPDPRYQQIQYQQQYQQQQQPQQGYLKFAPYQQPPPHPGHYGPQPYPAGYSVGQPGPQRMDTMSSNTSLPNSFTRSPVASSAPSVSTAPSSDKQTLHLASAPDDILEGGSGSGLRRQPTQSSGAPPAYVDETGELNKYRDVKMRPVIMTPPTESSGESSAAATPAAAPAPTTAAKRISTHSAYSLYDQEDIYGGI